MKPLPEALQCRLPPLQVMQGMLPPAELALSLSPKAEKWTVKYIFYDSKNLSPTTDFYVFTEAKVYFSDCNTVNVEET